jgi:hypothetical protein
LDGTTLVVTVAQRGLVREVKRLVGQVRVSKRGTANDTHLVSFCAQSRDMDPGLIELFVDGQEDGLPDSGRLDLLGLGEGSVVFLLQRAGWHWTACGSEMALSEDGLVATAGSDGFQLVTGGEPMTEGRHYWEVEVTKQVDTKKVFLVGAVRPGLDHDESHWNTDGACFINAASGSLYGNGKLWADRQGAFAEGDRVGVLLDLDAGWLRFYRNSKRCGPGFTEGVTGPLVRAAQVVNEGDTLTVLPGAVAPEGAGAADEPGEEPTAPEPEPESESEADDY